MFDSGNGIRIVHDNIDSIRIKIGGIEDEHEEVNRAARWNSRLHEG